VYGEIFIAAIESAAFVESDKFELIDIGLSYIPKNCACARAVRRVIELYRSGLDWKETRYQLMRDFPGSFGAQWHGVEEGIINSNWGYDAPNNIAITLIGWLYADNDFGKAICITTGCGEDSDCTAGALGAILGIILGESALPAKWTNPIGEEIKTKCINRFMKNIRIPKTLTELSKRTVNLMPSFITEYVDISTTVDKKIEMLNCHASQIVWMRDHDGIDFPDMVRTCSRYRGYQCGATYAEGFKQCNVYLKGTTKRLLP
jgi:hypothetical protein